MSLNLTNKAIAAVRIFNLNAPGAIVAVSVCGKFLRKEVKRKGSVISRFIRTGRKSPVLELQQIAQILILNPVTVI